MAQGRGTEGEEKGGRGAIWSSAFTFKSWRKEKKCGQEGSTNERMLISSRGLLGGGPTAGHRLQVQRKMHKNASCNVPL